MKPVAANERHYFVDEAGDLTLFDRRGNTIIGSAGCSNYFILGVALIENPHEVRAQLAGLREQVLRDPYLKDIPSLQKTKTSFHAKNDTPEIKMQVFKLIATLPVKFYAIVRRKQYLVDWVRSQNLAKPGWRFNENQMYDECVMILFKDRLHLAQQNNVMFARRGKSTRNEALKLSLQRAKNNFEKSKQRKIETVQHVDSNYSSNEPVLQVIDYGLWALQRLYERHEARYFDFLGDKFRRIIDRDDKRYKDYGVYYDDNNRLTMEKIKDSLEG